MLLVAAPLLRGIRGQVFQLVRYFLWRRPIRPAW